MEIEIFEKKENVLFDRTEVKFYVLYEGEPEPKAEGYAKVYGRESSLLDVEKASVIEKNKEPEPPAEEEDEAEE